MKKILIFLISLLLISASSMSSNINISSRESYIPSNISITYNLYNFTGHVVRVSTNQVILTIPQNVSDIRVDILSRVPITINVPQTVIPSMNTCGSLLQIPLYVGWTQTPGRPDFDCNNTLQNSYGYAWDGSKQNIFYGEIVNQFGNLIIPPEPKFSLNPFVGQVININSTVYTSLIDSTITYPYYPTTLYTLAWVSSWHHIPDVWITVLNERGSLIGGNDHIYEYVFANGIGVIDSWQGELINGSINGIEYVMSSYSVIP